MSVAPPSVPVVTLSSQVTAAAVLATVIEATQSFEALPVGSLFNASLTGKDAAGLLLLRGETGPLTLRTGAVLPENGKLLMQVLSNGASPQLRLLAIDGMALLPTSLGQLDRATGMEIVMRQAANFAASKGLSLEPFAGLTDPVQLGAQGGGLMGRVVQSDAPPFGGQLLLEAGKPLAPLPTGSMLTLRLYDIRPPEAGGPPLLNQATPGSAVPLQAGLAGIENPLKPINIPAQATPQQLPGMAANPQTNPVTSQNIPLPDPSLSLAQSSDRPTLSGIVQQQGAGGHVLVRTSIGLLDISSPIPLATGSLLTLGVAAVAPPVQPVNQTAAPPSFGWPAMEEAMATLEASNPDAARQLAALIPQSGPRLAANMAIFVSALRGGELRSLVGPQALQTLEKTLGKEGIKKLEEEFKSAGSRSRGTSSPSGNWNAYSIPFANGALIEPIQFYVRPPPPEETDENGSGRKRQGGGTRFVLDVTLSQLGHLQLDGLVRSPGAFDLIFRSENALSPEMRADIAKIFADIGAATGMGGGITFQAGTRALIDIEAVLPADVSRKSGLVV
jgi:hypothetical protein